LLVIDSLPISIYSDSNVWSFSVLIKVVKGGRWKFINFICKKKPSRNLLLSNNLMQPRLPPNYSRRGEKCTKYMKPTNINKTNTKSNQDLMLKTRGGIQKTRRTN
jgi:hypothetical protein